MAGTYHPFSQYTQDLTRSIDGRSQIFLSHYVACTFNGNAANISNQISQAQEKYIAQCLSNKTDIDYGQLREIAWKLIQPNIANAETNAANSPCIGELNFNSYDIVGGLIHSDVYLHIQPEVPQKYILLHEGARPETPEITLFDTDEGNEIVKQNSSRSNFSFNCIILFYSLYQVDPTFQTSMVKPIVLDIPAGLYMVSGSVSCSDDASTAWTTRLCSRIVAESSTSIASDGSKMDNYSTLTQALAKMGEVVQQVDNVLHTAKNPLSTTVRTADDSGVVTILAKDLVPLMKGLTYDDLKAYLDFFRSEGAVNVPYVRDGYWFVNGRKIVKIFENDSAALQSVYDQVEEFLHDNPNFKGDTGDTGPQGEQGNDGKVWYPHIDELGNIYWELKEYDGSEPDSANIRGPIGPKGSDGKSGKIYWPEVDSDGKLTWKLIDEGELPDPAETNIMGPEGNAADITDLERRIGDIETWRDGEATEAHNKVDEIDQWRGDVETWQKDTVNVHIAPYEGIPGENLHHTRGDIISIVNEVLPEDKVGITASQVERMLWLNNLGAASRPIVLMSGKLYNPNADTEDFASENAAYNEYLAKKQAHDDWVTAYNKAMEDGEDETTWLAAHPEPENPTEVVEPPATSSGDWSFMGSIAEGLEISSIRLRYQDGSATPKKNGYLAIEFKTTTAADPLKQIQGINVTSVFVEGDDTPSNRAGQNPDLNVSKKEALQQSIAIYDAKCISKIRPEGNNPITVEVYGWTNDWEEDGQDNMFLATVFGNKTNPPYSLNFTVIGYLIPNVASYSVHYCNCTNCTPGSDGFYQDCGCAIRTPVVSV